MQAYTLARTLLNMHVYMRMGIYIYIYIYIYMKFVLALNCLTEL